MDEFIENKQEVLNEISEVNPTKNELCSQVNRVCEPEYFFEMIEQCKICGRCV